MVVAPSDPSPFVDYTAAHTTDVTAVTPVEKIIPRHRRQPETAQLVPPAGKCRLKKVVGVKPTTQKNAFLKRRRPFIARLIHQIGLPMLSRELNPSVSITPHPYLLIPVDMGSVTHCGTMHL
jgi:hypothetical protein